MAKEKREAQTALAHMNVSNTNIMHTTHTYTYRHTYTRRLTKEAHML